MKNFIYILTLCTLLFSCNSDNDNNNDNYYNLDTDLWFKVSSPDGVDLLDPNNPNAYLEGNIKIYYLNENGELKEINNPQMDSPRNFSIVSPEDSGSSFYAFNIGLNAQGEIMETEPDFYDIENAITCIEWNETDTDTIRANFRAGDNFMKLSKAWYNEELIYDEDTTESIPEIIKN